jgi:flagellar biosynthesis/type III secretory pathway protein FliH
LPSILHNPAVRDGIYFLRPPAPPASNGHELPVIYTEADLAAARAEGEAAGREAEQAALEQLRAEWAEQGQREAAGLVEAAKALAAERTDLLTTSAEGLVELAFRIARTVLRREIEADPSSVVPVLRDLLSRTDTFGALTVRLSPRDHAAVQEMIESIPEAAGLEGLRLRSDPKITSGGCLLETEAGRLDGRLETQLERIEAALRKREVEFHQEARTVRSGEAAGKVEESA